MEKLELKYGCNPNQKPAYLTRAGGGDLPFRVLNGRQIGRASCRERV